ncbi:sugar transferase [Planomicrobium sp. CPCC 101110]|uniref:sugar transferase n=1 Tax=Planomicrobium sp. CPCC 101110 TaxID=2599619 RepID=UPI0011B75975|nr:sugar transferase [Planomicrobium sp. CPCC 101110]TWT27859.1 sugar transferase [Planomicrobium sp. CPCC 101110]
MKFFIKKLFDISSSLIALIIFSPLLIVLSLIVFLNMGSPFIFKHERPGLKGKLFVMYKFRTMTDEKDENGQLLPDHIRLTKLGRFLRSTSLDELPELINVLKGDMSLVGPRPLEVEYLERYSPEQMRRHDVKPGITGWAQVNGRNELAWENRFKLDVWYVDNHNFFIDLKIIFITILRVLQRDGVEVEGNSSGESFYGNIKKEEHI